MGFEKEVTIASIHVTPYSILVVLTGKYPKTGLLKKCIVNFENAKTCNASLERVIQGLGTFCKTVLCEFVLCGDVLCGDSLYLYKEMYK